MSHQQGRGHSGEAGVAARFWGKVEKSTGCWVWTASRNKMGYGQFKAPFPRGCVLAHRFAWELEHGPPPDNACVLHKCDNPRCVRTGHMFLGTRTDNAADKVSKGRQSHTSMPGSANPFAKLTEDSARAIRKLVAEGLSAAEAGRRFGVSKSTAARVVKGVRWSHV